MVKFIDFYLKLHILIVEQIKFLYLKITSIKLNVLLLKIINSIFKPLN